MKKLIYGAIACALLSTSAVQAQSSLTSAQKKQGWHLLFNGKDTKGWHLYLKPDAAPAWTIVDGALQLDPKGTNRGDLLTNGEYENYEFSVEWKISPEGNSGIIFGVHEDTTYKHPYDTGIEMQVLDDEKAEDNKKANHLAGSLYDMKAPAVKTVKPAGEWNQAKIWKKNGYLIFTLNGKEVINVQMGSEEWKTLIAQSKFKDWKGFAAYAKGKIALQDHGHIVAFRNIMIRQL
jgi:hypothetical protein